MNDRNSNPLPFEMAERERQFRLVLDNIDLPICYYGRDLVFHFVNRQYAELLNLPESQILGRNLREIIGDSAFGQVKEHIDRALSGTRVTFERDRSWPDRRLRRARISMFPDIGAEGTVRGLYVVSYDIDEDHRLRGALKAREEQLVRFADNIPEPIIYLDRDLRYRFVNRAFLDFRHVSREQVVGRTVPEVRGAEFAGQLQPLVERAFKGQQAVFEHRSRMHDGTLRWNRARLVPDIGPSGAVEGVYAVIVDIDEMKRAQQALADSEGQLRAFIDGIPTPVAYVNNQWRYEYLNRAFAEFCEIDAAQIQGRAPREIVKDDDYEVQAASLARAMAGEQIEYERLMSFANRPARWMQVRLVPDRERDGPIRGVFLLLNDIQVQKESEAAIRRINWVLSSHIENTPMAVAEWDKDLKLIRWSPRAEAIFGWKAEEILGSSLREWKLVFGADVPKVDAVIQTMLTGERTSATSTNRNIRKDGSTIWCEWQNSVLRDENGELLSLLGFAHDVSDRVDAQEKLEAMATHDALTGLPNRVLLHLHLAEALDRARQRHQRVAILFIDLDRFKNVNDSLGHRIGDELLRMIGRRLGLALRKGDFLARLGGDEFTVLLEDLKDAEGAAEVAVKLLELIQQAYWVHGHAVHVSASIGLSMFPDDGDDPDTLLKNADVAMYRAKDAGKNVYQFFAHEMGTQQQEQMALETALRRAVKSEALELKFQPKVAIATGRIAGAEALLRWHDAILGDVPPARFIPLAEESGLIDAMGDWLLTRACREMRHWAAAGLDGMTIAINLSVRQFRDAGFPARIQKVFAETGVDPHRVEFEVTETSVLYDAESVSRVLQMQRELGVRVAIDDFGTGYSSLVHLKRLPIDTLKIDQSFIRDITTDPDDKAITAAIIALAHSLGLDVVAEGVETEEQLAFLTERGCDYYQGHYLSEPLDCAAFIEFVLRHRERPAQAPVRAPIL